MIFKNLPPPTTRKVNNLSLSASEQFDEALSKHSIILFLKALACSNCFKKKTLCLFVPVGLCSDQTASSSLAIPGTPKVFDFVPISGHA